MESTGCAQDTSSGALGETQHGVAKAAVTETVPHKAVGLRRGIAAGSGALGCCDSASMSASVVVQKCTVRPV